MAKEFPSYFISYEYYDVFDMKKTLKQDSFVTTDGLLYISPSDFRILSENIQKDKYRIVTKYIDVRRLDKTSDSTKVN